MIVHQTRISMFAGGQFQATLGLALARNLESISESNSSTRTATEFMGAARFFCERPGARTKREWFWWEMVREARSPIHIERADWVVRPRAEGYCHIDCGSSGGPAEESANGVGGVPKTEFSAHRRLHKEFRLCLPQILSAAEGRRPITA